MNVISFNAYSALEGAGRRASEPAVPCPAAASNADTLFLP
jgi:hypothetical protein